PRFDIFDIDGRARFEILHALELRDIDEDPTSEDSILEIVNRVFGVTVCLLDLFGIRLVAVVKHAVVVDVRERVEMRMSNSVERDSDTIGTESKHLVLIWLWIIYRLFRIGVTGERDREALLDQSSSLFPLCRRDEVHRADLIVFAPAAPVIEVLLPLFELIPGFFVACIASLRSTATHRYHHDCHDCKNPYHYHL